VATWLITVATVATVLVAVAVVYMFLIRPWHLRWGATSEETTAPLPGDDLVPDPKSEAPVGIGR
jgi:hypothetical protein